MRVSGPFPDFTVALPRASQPPAELEISNSSEPTSLPATVSRNLPFCAVRVASVSRDVETDFVAGFARKPERAGECGAAAIGDRRIADASTAANVYRWRVIAGRLP